MRLDPRLDDDGYARGKLAGIVGGRMALVKAVAERGSVEALGDRFEWLRVTRFDGPDPA